MRSLLSPRYICHASMSCLELLMHEIACALHFALLNAGSSIAASMAMIAITTNNSIKVKADFGARISSLSIAESGLSVHPDRDCRGGHSICGLWELSPLHTEVLL